MKLSRTAWINIGLGTAVVLAGVSAYIIVNPAEAAGTSSEGTQLTGTVQQGVVSTSITASGQIEAATTANASFEVSGTIASVRVDLGEEVEQGDVLAVLDRDDLREALADAEESLSDAAGDLSDAKSALSSAKKGTKVTDPDTGETSRVVDAQTVSQAEDAVDSAADRVDSAADAVEEAEADLEAAVLRAPIGGLVIAVNATVGDSASGSSGSSGSSSALFTVADTSELTVTASIAEADIAEVSIGQAATVEFPALDGVSAAATVTMVSPTGTASNSVVTFSTTITLDEIPEGLRLGQTAEVSIVVEASAEDALYVPSAAITTDTDGATTVEVVAEDGTTSVVTVTTGVVGDQGTEITSGLEEGQTVVLGTVVETEGDSGTEQTFPEDFGGNFGGGTPPGGGFGGQG